MPNEISVNLVLSDVLEIICEGDPCGEDATDCLGGLRASQILDSEDSDSNVLWFKDQYENEIKIEVDVVNNKVCRDIGDGEGCVQIPYSVPGLDITGKEGEAFHYYDEFEKELDDPIDASLVKRVEISLQASIGDSNADLTTSVCPRKPQ